MRIVILGIVVGSAALSHYRIRRADHASLVSAVLATGLILVLTHFARPFGSVEAALRLAAPFALASWGIALLFSLLPWSSWRGPDEGPAND